MNEIRIGTIKILDGKQSISLEDTLEIFEFLNIQKQISGLCEFENNQELYSIFLINFIEISRYLEESVAGLASEQKPILHYNRKNIQVIYRNVNRLFLNLLGSARTFLDHTETYLKRKYGKKSIKVAGFKRKTNELYDSSFEYRFIYKLRNFAQHCGFPVSEISIRRRGREIILNPIFKKQILLNNFPGWGSQVKGDIEKQLEEFSATPIISEFFRNIQELNDKVRDIEKTSVLEFIKNIEDFILKYKNQDKDSQLCIFHDFKYDISGSLEGASFNSITIPLDLIENIKISFRHKKEETPS